MLSQSWQDFPLVTFPNTKKLESKALVYLATMLSKVWISAHLYDYRKNRKKDTDLCHP